MKKELSYLTDCERHMKRAQDFHQPLPKYSKSTSFPPFPKQGLVIAGRLV